MHLIRGLNATGKESGQILVLFALLLPLLCSLWGSESTLVLAF